MSNVEHPLPTRLRNRTLYPVSTIQAPAEKPFGRHHLAPKAANSARLFSIAHGKSQTSVRDTLINTDNQLPTHCHHVTCV